MKLTEHAQALLDGKHGRGLTKAMEILMALGRIYDAKDMVPVTSAQIAGVSDKNIGDPGLEFLTDWANQDARVHRFIDHSRLHQDLLHMGEVPVLQDRGGLPGTLALVAGRYPF